MCKQGMHIHIHLITHTQDFLSASQIRLRRAVTTRASRRRRAWNAELTLSPRAVRRDDADDEVVDSDASTPPDPSLCKHVASSRARKPPRRAGSCKPKSTSAAARSFRAALNRFRSTAAVVSRRSKALPVAFQSTTSATAASSHESDAPAGGPPAGQPTDSEQSIQPESGSRVTHAAPMEVSEEPPSAPVSASPAPATPPPLSHPPRPPSPRNQLNESPLVPPHRWAALLTRNAIQDNRDQGRTPIFPMEMVRLAAHEVAASLIVSPRSFFGQADAERRSYTFAFPGHSAAGQLRSILAEYRGRSRPIDPLAGEASSPHRRPLS